MNQKGQERFRALNKQLDDMVEHGMETTKRWVTMWVDSLRYFFSDQLRGAKKKKNWDWVVLNYIWPSAQQEIAKLSRHNPKSIAQPVDSQDIEIAKMWESGLNWQWQYGINDEGMRKAQMCAILDGKIFGYRVSYWYWEPRAEWDPETKQWVGAVRHRLWHPAFFWADDAEHVQEGNCGTQRYVRLDWAISRWPEHEEALRDQATEMPEPQGGWATYNIRGGSMADGITSETTGYPDRENDGDVHAHHVLFDRIVGADPMTRGDGFKDVEVVKIEQVWFRDHETRHQKEEAPARVEDLLATGAITQSEGRYYDTESGDLLGPEQWPTITLREYDEPVYPFGRYVLRAGHVVLNPEPEQQVWPYRKWPFVVVPHYLLPHMWQGSDAVQLYKSVQDMINVSASHLYNNMKQYGDPRVLVEEGALPVRQGKKSKILSGAGAVINVVRGALSRNAIKIEPPAPMSPSAVMMYELMAQEYKNIQGTQSIARGEKDTGRMTATQAMALATSSNDRIQLQSVFEDMWVRDCMQWIAWIMQREYTPERMIRIVGEDNVAGVVQFSQGMKDFRFDVAVVPGAMLPFDEEKKLAKMMTAYQLVSQGPHPLLGDLLRELGLHNWRQILQQTPGYAEYMQFLQLRQAVAQGEMDPRQALMMLARGIQTAALEGQTQANPDAAPRKEVQRA